MQVFPRVSPPTQAPTENRFLGKNINLFIFLTFNTSSEKIGMIKTKNAHFDIAIDAFDQTAIICLKMQD